MTEENTWSKEEQAILDQNLPMEEASIELEKLWMNPTFENNKIGKWGMKRFDFLMKNFPQWVIKMAEHGELEAYLNLINRICSYRTDSPAAETIPSLIQNPSLKLVITPEDEKLAFLADHWNYPFMIKKERPPEKYFLTLYGRKRLKFLTEWRQEEFRHLVQQGELAKHLLQIQDEMYDKVQNWMKQYLEKHPAPSKSNPLEYAGYMNMTKMQAEEALQEDVLYR